jgi:sec-independent protein translocase protein TatB
MLDFSFGELLLLGVIALVVLGPEKLPHAARMAGAWVGRIRRSVISIQAEIEREVAVQEMKQRIEQESQRIRNSEIAQQLQKDISSIGQQVQEAGGSAEAALRPEPPAIRTRVPTDAVAAAAPVTSPPPATPAAPAEAPKPDDEKPGEEAFKAYVQASGHKPADTTS